MGSWWLCNPWASNWVVKLLYSNIMKTHQCIFLWKYSSEFYFSNGSKLWVWETDGDEEKLLYWPFLNHDVPHSYSGLYIFSLMQHIQPVFARGYFVTPRLKTAYWRLLLLLPTPSFLDSAWRSLSMTDWISSGCKTEIDRYSVGTCINIIT